MDFAAILYQKGLYKLSLKILDKAKALAMKNEEKYAAFDIVEFEKLIESQYITRSLTNRAQELIIEADNLRTHNDLTSQLSNLSLLLYEQLIKTGYAKSDDEFGKLPSFSTKKCQLLSWISSDLEKIVVLQGTCLVQLFGSRLSILL